MSSEQTNERKALMLLIDPNALEPDAYPFPGDAADRVIAAGWRPPIVSTLGELIWCSRCAFCVCGDPQHKEYSPSPHEAMREHKASAHAMAVPVDEKGGE